MAGFGAKVKLSVDKSTAARTEFNEQINSMVKQIKISNKFTVLQKDMDRVRKDAQTMLNNAPIKITKIDCSAAVNDLRKKLQNVINSLSIKNGVSITGLVDPAGTGKLGTQIDDVTEAAKQGQAEIDRMNAQMQVLKTTMQSLATVYKSALPGAKNAIQDPTELNSLISRYTELQNKINEIKSSNQVASKESIDALQREALAIQEKISQIQAAQIAIEQEAAAQAKASKDAQADAKKDAADLTAKNRLYGEAYTLLDRVQKAQRDWTAAENGKSKSSYAELEKYAGALKKIINNWQSMSREEMESELRKVTLGWKQSSSAIKDAGENTKTFSERVGSLAQKFGAWLSVTQVIMAGIRAIKKMVTAVTDIDTAMTELKKVTNETDATYSQFLDNAATRAKRLGSTIADTVNASADFARLGYTISEAEELADAALVYKNVGDGIENIGDASESIISTMKAFNVEAEDAMFIVDKFNETGNNFAISSKGVGDALLRSASALSAANNSLDESIALITAANSTVQDADKVGTALKTISMYLRAAKTEAEDAGESTDGMATSVSELREELLSLTGGKVDIQLDEDTFKSTYQIMKDLSEVWGSLTDITQANIIELIGGKRNSNVITSMLQNFDVAEQVIKSSADASGSALAENEKYLDSINGKVDELKATFEELSVTLIDSEFVKQIIEFGTGLLNILNALAKVIDAVGGLNTVLGVTVGLLITLKAAKIVDALKKPLDAIRTSTEALRTSGVTIKEFFVNTFAQATAGATSLSTALSTTLGVVGLLIALGTVAYTIYQRVHKSTEELRQEYDDLSSSVDDLNEELQTNKDRIEELQLLSNEGKITLVEQEELDKLIETNSQLERQIRLEKERAQIAADKTNASVVKDFNRQQFVSGAGLNTLIDADALYEKNRKQFDAYEQAMAGWADEWNSFTASEQERITELYGQYQNMLLDGNGTLNTPDYLGYEEYVQELIARYKELSDLGSNATDSQLDQLDSIRSELVELGSDLQNDYIDMFVGESEDVDNWNHIADAIDACINPAEHFSSLLSELPQDLQKVLSVEGSGGDLTADRISELAAKYSALSDWMAESGYTAEEVANHYNALARSEGSISAQNALLSNSLSELIAKMSNVDSGDDITSRITELTAKKARLLAEMSALQAGDAIPNEQYADLEDLVSYYDTLIEEVAEKGIDLSQTIYGNIDTNNRQIIEWTDENLRKYDAAIKSWGLAADELKGSISTVLGGSDNFGGIEIAFTPMLQTGDGAVLLDSNTVSEYIWGLLDRAKRDTDGNIDVADFLRLDMEGLEFDGQKIQNLIADIGDTAIQTGEAMHYVGDLGAVQSAYNELETLAQKYNMSWEELVKYIRDFSGDATSEDRLRAIRNEIAGINGEIQALNGSSVETQTANGIIGIFTKIISGSEALQKAFGGMAIPDFLEQLQNSSAGSAKDITKYLDAAEAIDALKKQLTDAQSEMFDSGTISAETAKSVYESLTAAGEDYTQYLVVEGEQIKLNTSAYNDFIQTQILEKNGVLELTRALADQLALQEQIRSAEAAFNATPIGDRTMGQAMQISDMKQQLQSLKETYGDTEELQNTIDLLDKLFSGDLEKRGIDGIDAALDKTKTKTEELSRALNIVQETGSLDDLSETDFSNLISSFPRLKRALTDYRNGTISATQVTQEFQAALDSINAETVFDNLNTAKDSVSVLAGAINELNSDGGISFDSLSKIQGSFSNVAGIDTYLQKLQETKGNTEEVANIIGTLLYAALKDAMGSVEDLANADETLIASMLKEAGVANATAVAHQAVEQARKESAVASKVSAASTVGEITALLAEAKSAGTTTQAIYNLIAQELIFNNSNMNVSQKLEALAALAQAAGVAAGAISGVNGSLLGGATGLDSRYTEQTIKGLLQTGQVKTRAEAEQRVLANYWKAQTSSFSNVTVTNPFDGIDFTPTGSGGDEAETQATKIKSAYDELSASLEHAIYLQEQYYNVADKEDNYAGMDQSLEAQLNYYKQLQSAAHDAAQQIRAFYKSQGLSDAMIDQQSEIQELQKAWWNAANSIDDCLDKIASAVREKLSKQLDDIQNVYDTLHNAADEYAASGFISIDTLQTICNDLGPKYMAYLRDENGQLVINEENIRSVIAARTEQLAVETALSYVEQLRTALAENDIATLNNLLYATEAATGATWGLVYANLGLLNLNDDQYQAALSNINAIRALADSAISGIGQTTNQVSDSLQEMKDGLDDILKYVMDMLKQRIQDQIDALEDMKDAYSDIIDLRKEALEAAQEEADYQDEVAEKVKEIAKLQERINALSVDDSRDAQAQKIKLEEEMAELQKELSKSQADYAVDAQKDALDDMQDAYEEQKDAEIKVLEDSISSYQKLYDMAIEYIESHWDTLYDELLSWNYQYGDELSSTITTAWENALAAAQRYGSYVSALGSIDADISSANASTSNTVVGKTNYDSTASNEDMIHAIIKEMYANSQAHHTASQDEKTRLDKRNLTLGAMLSQYGISAIRSNGTWYINRAGGELLFDKYRQYTYHTGGIVGNQPSLKQKEVLAILEKDEAVLDQKKQRGLYQIIDFTTALSDKLGKLVNAVDLSHLFGNMRGDFGDSHADVPVTNNQSEMIHFGDVYIYGANEETIEQHREVNRQFTNEVIKQLNLRR